MDGWMEKNIFKKEMDGWMDGQKKKHMNKFMDIKIYLKQMDG